MDPFIASTALFDAYGGADFFGKLIFISLFVLSIVSWALLIYKVWLVHKVKSMSDSFHGMCSYDGETFFSLDQMPVAQHKEVPNAFFEIYKTLKKHTLDILKKNQTYLQGSSESKGEEQAYLCSADIEYVDAQLQTVVSKQRNILEKYLFILSTTVSLAPFLGLLGTVWGILATFGNLQNQSLGSSQEMLGGLSMALGTTVLGLLVAIPAIIAHSYLRQYIRDFETEMYNFANELIATVEMFYRKVDLY